MGSIPMRSFATYLCSVTAQAIRSLLSGDLAPRVASALAQLCNSAYRTLPIVDLETRIKRVEAQFREEEGKTPPGPDPVVSPIDERPYTDMPQEKFQPLRQFRRLSCASALLATSATVQYIAFFLDIEGQIRIEVVK